MSKRYFIPGIDEIRQLVETPASKEKTEKNRFVINTVISTIAAIFGIIATVISLLAYLK